MKSNYLKVLRPDVGRAYFGLDKGELHPIERGYNAEHYGSGQTGDLEAETGKEKIIHVRFCGQRA